MKLCGCCQTLYDSPKDLVTFGQLTDAGGKTWAICGKCIRVMWRKRQPKVKALV